MFKIFFRITRFREYFSKVRFNHYSKRIRNYKITKNILESEYSKNAFSKYNSIPARIDYLCRIIRLLEPKKNTKLLSIGPRFESELFGYMGLGISRKNISAVDTYSYSPLIQVGDAHDLKFVDNSFDIVVIGWTLAYSKNPGLFISEAVRVCSKMGFIVLTYDLQSNIEMYIKKAVAAKYPVIPLVNKQNYILKNFKNFTVKRFTLENVFWKGAIKPTPIGLLVLEKL